MPYTGRSCRFTGTAARSGLALCGRPLSSPGFNPAQGKPARSIISAGIMNGPTSRWCKRSSVISGNMWIGDHRDLIAFVPDRKGHDFRYGIDPAKICNELGWRPEPVCRRDCPYHPLVPCAPGLAGTGDRRGIPGVLPPGILGEVRPWAFSVFTPWKSPVSS